jgi:hypothetical protein
MLMIMDERCDLERLFGLGKSIKVLLRLMVACGWSE